MQWRTRRMKFLIVPVVAAMAVLSAACGGSSGSTAASSKNFGVGATGTVHFWARQATDGPAKALVASFNATHKNLKIVLHLTPPNDDTSQLATAIRAGSVPDVVGLNDIDVPAFARENALMDITKYVNALTYKSSLSPGHLQLATNAGKYYGVPYLADLSVLWYNKTLFRQAGLNPDVAPSSYAEIVTDAEKINALGHGISGFSFAGNCQGCLGFTMLPSLWAAGQHMITGPLGSQKANVTGDGPLKTMLAAYQTIWAKHLAPAADQTQNGLTWGKDFEAGKVGILPGDYGFAAAFTTPAQHAEFADAPLPAVNGGGFSTFDGGDDFVIPAGAANPSGAWEFIKWALDSQQQVKYPSEGMTPIRSDVLTPSFAATNPYDAVALQALAKGSVEYTLAYDAVFNEPGSPWFKMFEEAVYSGNVNAGIQQGQTGVQSTLDTVKG
ncbi:MAG: multiple sugar transport system substrate-binding protein [Streptosporangiaceae bacterium]|jgi:multiple sugar transport system substrate-binding protein|nr:multiple sugar transport system substrate-binding protein [Streptosporangiaceae bacterium]